jgi:hypothetical protein
MLEHTDYRKFATFNRLIADTRARLEHQKERVLVRADEPDGCTAAKHLRQLQCSLRLMTHCRSALIRQLIKSPSWIEYRNSLQRGAIDP